MKIDSGCSNGAWWQVGGGEMVEECRGGGNYGINNGEMVVEVTMVVVEMAVDR